MAVTRIFFDLDETLIHSVLEDEGGAEFDVSFEDGTEKYYVHVRIGIRDVIEYACSVVGEDNVFILTIATKAYATIINERANFGFKPENIFSHEDIEYHTIKTAYGDSLINPHIYAHKDNLLIDNLPHYDNKRKIDFIGISKTVKDNYLETKDYYGVDTESDAICDKIKKFIEERNNA